MRRARERRRSDSAFGGAAGGARLAECLREFLRVRAAIFSAWRGSIMLLVALMTSVSTSTPSIRSSAQVSEQTMYAPSSLPMTSGRKPQGSRAAIRAAAQAVFVAARPPSAAPGPKS